MINKYIIKNLFIILVLLYISFFNTRIYANNDSFTIKKIYFEGLKRISINTATHYIPFNIGDSITNNDISNIIKILFSTGKFENVQIFNNQSTLIIKVKEYPIISDITFHGNKSIKTEILKNNLKLQKIQIGNFLNPSVIFKIEKSLKNFYRNIGKYNAVLTIQTITIPDNQVKLQINFDEGISSIIRHINIIGNQKLQTKKLLNLFQLTNNNKYWNLFRNKQYNQEYLLHDLESLRNFYLNHGFAAFNIDSTQITLTQDKKNIFITINITEGSQYKISDILIDGNIIDFFKDIKNTVKISPGELYNFSKIQTVIHNIKNILENHGYIKPDILIDSEINDNNKTIKLYFNININKCFYVRKIKFQGNNITNDSVLRREMRQMEKTWINNNLIQQGQERLNRLGYFESIEVLIKHIPTTIDQLDVIYKIKERNTGNININLGLGSESGINFQCGIQQENLFGTGNAFRLSGIKNNYQTYIELSSNNPYFTAKNIGLGGKIFFNNFNTDNTNLTTYGLESSGINSDINFPISDYNSLNIGFDCIYNSLNNIQPQVAICRYLNSQGILPKISKNTKHIKTHTMNFNTHDVFLTFNWKFNNLNHNFSPTYGSCSNLSGKITIPGSTNKYYKMIIDANHYIPLHKNNNWILMNRIYAGYANGLYSKKESPFFDNFYAGGINTIRGFRTNTIGPKAAYYQCNQNDNTYTSCKIKNSNNAIGGNAIAILQGELITPSPFLNKQYIHLIRTSIFIDLGTVWDTYWKDTQSTKIAGIPNYNNPTNIRISSGLAVQWISPLGPIVFSYAKLLKKYTGDKLEQFQFNIGKTW